MAERIPQRFYERRPARVLGDAALSWALVAAAVAAAALWREPWVWALAVLVIGSQQYALQILLHDGQHGTLLRTRRATRRFARWALSAPLLMPYESFRAKHLAHHRHLGSEADPDRYYHRSADKGTLGRFAWFLTALGSALSTAAGALRGSGTRSAGRPRDAARSGPGDVAPVVAAQLALAAALTAAAGPWGYPLLWWLPYFVGLFLMQNLRSFAEHAHPEPDALADRHRLVTFVSHPVERFFVAPHNMNFHAEHHLHPQVPYYHLPALRRHLEAQGALRDVEFRGSYLGFALRFASRLPIRSSAAAS
jgi:fatty acid desaturase